MGLLASILRRVPLAMAAVFALCLPAAAQSSATGILADGAQWQLVMPAHWNGVLLLYSHGYNARRQPAEAAPPKMRQPLLRAGYALVGSSYASNGWAIADALRDQPAAIDAFTQHYGKPRKVIAWGMSMGGLITTGLAEHPAGKIDGALALCGSIGGAVGMMNMALDGAYAFRVLVAPKAGIALTYVTDDMENSKRVAAALQKALETPGGRARVVLVAVLAGIPPWTDPTQAEPAPSDYANQARQMAASIVRGVFLPRGDQEKRAGGAFSWNTDVDYRQQLLLSGRRPMVAALYRAAGIDLDADLARLNAGARVSAVPSAVDYMMRYYTPSGDPKVPFLAVQLIGDGATSPSLQGSYASEVTQNGKKDQFRALWMVGAGHCNFTPEQMMLGIDVIKARVLSGSWPAPPAEFIDYTPPPMLRPCFRNSVCR